MSSAVVTYSSPDVAERVLASSESVLGCDDVQLMPLWADENDEPAGITEALLHSLNNTHTHTQPLNGPFSGTTQVSRYQKGKPIWILLKQETVSDSGISWAICKSAPSSRQTTAPAPHHSVFKGQMPFLSPNQQRQSTEGPFS